MAGSIIDSAGVAATLKTDKQYQCFYLLGFNALSLSPDLVETRTTATLAPLKVTVLPAICVENMFELTLEYFQHGVQGKTVFQAFI